MNATIEQAQASDVLSEASPTCDCELVNDDGTSAGMCGARAEWITTKHCCSDVDLSCGDCAWDDWLWIECVCGATATNRADYIKSIVRL